jgi:ABC-type thiamine transport system substrate-binding protein
MLTGLSTLPQEETLHAFQAHCTTPVGAGPARCCRWLPALAQKTQLLVYTALETDQLKAYQEGFNKVHPDIDIKWVRDSTGVITAKLLAEKANPQADVVMGVAASSLALLDKNGMLEPYGR